MFATHAGMTVEAFNTIAADWAAKATDHRWHKPYTELVYQPMQEVLGLLRANGYRTYIVTGGGQAFVRAYAERVYGVAPAEVIGSSLETGYQYDAKGQGELIREPKLELNNNNSGKAEDIYLFTGQRPQAAFGNSTGDREMLEWTTAGKGKRLGMLVLHDDKEREYAYGPATGLPDTKVGTFTQALYDEADEARLDGDQHEERLEAHLRVRAVSVCHLGQARGEPSMSRVPAITLLTVALAAGCASDQQYLESGQSAATTTALERGRFELELSGGDRDRAVAGAGAAAGGRLAHDPDHPQRVHGRRQGCGQRATYVVVCPQGGGGCFAAEGGGTGRWLGPRGAADLPSGCRRCSPQFSFSRRTRASARARERVDARILTITILAGMAAGSCLLVTGTAQAQSDRACFRQAEASARRLPRWASCRRASPIPGRRSCAATACDREQDNLISPQTRAMASRDACQLAVGHGRAAVHGRSARPSSRQPVAIGAATAVVAEGARRSDRRAEPTLCRCTDAPAALAPSPLIRGAGAVVRRRGRPGAGQAAGRATRRRSWPNRRRTRSPT